MATAAVRSAGRAQVSSVVAGAIAGLGGGVVFGMLTARMGGCSP